MKCKKKKVWFRRFKVHMKGEYRVELSPVGATSTGHRCVPTTGRVACRVLRKDSVLPLYRNVGRRSAADFVDGTGQTLMSPQKLCSLETEDLSRPSSVRGRPTPPSVLPTLGFTLDCAPKEGSHSVRTKIKENRKPNLKREHTRNFNEIHVCA